jgi:hypothetical protein
MIKKQEKNYFPLKNKYNMKNHLFLIKCQNNKNL